MEDIGLCDGRNIKLLPLVEFMHEGTLTVATTNKEFFVLHVQSNTTIFYLLVQ